MSSMYESPQVLLKNNFSSCSPGKLFIWPADVWRAVLNSIYDFVFCLLFVWFAASGLWDLRDTWTCSRWGAKGPSDLRCRTVENHHQSQLLPLQVFNRAPNIQYSEYSKCQYKNPDVWTQISFTCFILEQLKLIAFSTVHSALLVLIRQTCKCWIWCLAD